MMDNKFKDYYKLLGVTPRATFENIRSAAEHELSQNWNNAMGRLEIQEAYEILSNPEKRKEYDEEYRKRLTEREIAINNARTFEEYIAATSLYPELSNVDVAPEVEVPQEEVGQIEINNKNTEDVSGTFESQEKQEQEESTIVSSTGSDMGGSSREDIDTSHDNEEMEQDLEEQVEEQYEEELEEEQQKEQAQEQVPEEKVEIEPIKENQELLQQNQEFINIPVQRLEKEIEQQKESNKQQIEAEPIISKAAVRELIRAAIIAGGIGVGVLTIGWSVPGVVLGLMAGVATGDFFKKHADKIKLERKPTFQKESKPLEIKEVNTHETQFLNEYSENLENQIYDLLDKPSKNYELEIAIRKYENLIELTEKRKYFKEKEKATSILKKLEIKALKDKLSRLEKTLKLLKEKQEQQTNKKDPRLSVINQELSNISHQTSKIENAQIEGKMMGEQEKEKLSDLKTEKATLLQKRDAKANRLYVNKDLISFGQVALVKLNSAITMVKSTVNKFTDLDSDEQLEESNTKSL